MARLFLHIGAHKTATSYLQALFHHNRQELAAAGLHYPVIGPNNAHHALAASWLDMIDLPPGFFGSEGPDGLWERAILRPYATRPGTVFLSAENFSRFDPQRVDMAALARRLAVFEEVRIVYTLRGQAEMLASLWVQIARSRKAPTLRRYLERAFATGMGGGVTLDHHAVYQHLRSGFRPEQIILLDYDEIRRRPGGVAQAFLDLMGVQLRAETLTPPPAETHNVSPDALSLWLACQICRDGPPPEDLIALTGTVLHGAAPRPTTLLSQSEYDKLRAKFRRDNARLGALVAPWQPGFRFDPPPPPETLLYRDQIPPHVWPDIAAALWAKSEPAGLPGLLRRAARKLIVSHGTASGREVVKTPRS